MCAPPPYMGRPLLDYRCQDHGPVRHRGEAFLSTCYTLRPLRHFSETSFVQDELLAWHRLKLWPRSPTHHYDMSHPQHPRDPQCNCQHLLSHSVRAFPGFDTLPSVQPLLPTWRGSTGCTSPLPLLLGLLHTLLSQRGLPPQLPNGSELRPAHPVTVHQGGTQDEGAPEAEVGARGGRSCF